MTKTLRKQKKMTKKSIEKALKTSKTWRKNNNKNVTNAVELTFDLHN